MLPKYLQHSHWYCLQYYSPTYKDYASGNKRHHRSLLPACLQSQTRVNFTGMPAVKTDMVSVNGDFCSHIGKVLQAVNVAGSLAKNFETIEIKINMLDILLL